MPDSEYSSNETVNHNGKSEAALYIIGLSIIMPLICMIVWLAINKNNGIRKCEAKIQQMQKSIDSLYAINKDLKDSLFRYNVFNEYNIIHNDKHITLIPKK